MSYYQLLCFIAIFSTTNEEWFKNNYVWKALNLLGDLHQRFHNVCYSHHCLLFAADYRSCWQTLQILIIYITSTDPCCEKCRLLSSVACCLLWDECPQILGKCLMTVGKCETFIFACLFHRIFKCDMPSGAKCYTVQSRFISQLNFSLYYTILYHIDVYITEIKKYDNI